MIRRSNKNGRLETLPVYFRRPAAFTLLEVAAALLVIAIISILLLPAYQPIIERAQEAICASNMRSIRLAMEGYLQDHQQVWPQGPAPQTPGWAPYWLAALAPYGIKERTWQCPSIRGYMKEAGQNDFGLHYVPTMFDRTPNIAHRWSTQPWLIEIADAHGKGPLICFPDGSVKPFSKVLAEQGANP